MAHFKIKNNNGNVVFVDQKRYYKDVVKAMIVNYFNLDNLDFRNRKLEGISFKGLILKGTNFTGAKLENASFENTTLEDVSFVNANIDMCSFRNARFINCKFDGCIGKADFGDQPIPGQVKEPVGKMAQTPWVDFLKWCRNYRKYPDRSEKFSAEHLRTIFTSQVKKTCSIEKCKKCIEKAKENPNQKIELFLTTNSFSEPRVYREFLNCKECKTCKNCCECVKCKGCANNFKKDKICSLCNTCPVCCPSFCYICNKCEKKHLLKNSCSKCGYCNENCCNCSIVGRFDNDRITFHDSQPNEINPSKRFIAAEIEVAGVKGPGRFVTKAVKNWAASIVYDGSIFPGQGPSQQSFEICTSPANGEKYISQIIEICKGLKDADAFLNNNCGLHVHVDARDFTPDDVRRLVKIYSKIENVLFSMVPDSRKESKFCKPCGQKYEWGIWEEKISNKEIETDRLIEKTVYGTNRKGEVENLKRNKRAGSSGSDTSTSRYDALNIHSYYYRGTIECRLFNGTISARKIVNWGIMWALIMDYVKRNTDEQVDKDMSGNEFQALYKAIGDNKAIKDFIFRRVMDHGTSEHKRLVEKVDLDLKTLEASGGKILVEDVPSKTERTASMFELWPHHKRWIDAISAFYRRCGMNSKENEQQNTFTDLISQEIPFESLPIEEFKKKLARKTDEVKLLEFDESAPLIMYEQIWGSNHCNCAERCVPYRNERNALIEEHNKKIKKAEVNKISLIDSLHKALMMDTKVVPPIANVNQTIVNVHKSMTYPPPNPVKVDLSKIEENGGNE